MKVYSHKERQGSPRYLQAQQTNYWFWERGYEVIDFEREELSSGAFDSILQHEADSCIFYGPVGAVREAVERAGRPSPPALDFPEELEAFVGRKIFETTMAEVRHWETHEPSKLPVHVKPIRQKLFVGKVVHAFRDLIPMANVPGDEPVLIQEVVEMKSEWRATILRGDIVNVSHYKGDPVTFPDKNVMKEALLSYTSAPIGFAMDWAVTSDGQTLLVEVNDGFSLGNYGVPGYLYTALLECRWREMMDLPDNGVGTDR